MDSNYVENKKMVGQILINGKEAQLANKKELMFALKFYYDKTKVLEEEIKKTEDAGIALLKDFTNNIKTKTNENS